MLLVELFALVSYMSPRTPARRADGEIFYIKKRVGNFTAKESSFRAARADGRGKMPRPRARSGLPRSREWWFVPWFTPG